MITTPDIAQSMDAAARAGGLYSLSVVQSGSEWQANLQVERGAGFRVCHGSTAGEAIAALFYQEALPPCPIPLPPCPVPA